MQYKIGETAVFNVKIDAQNPAIYKMFKGMSKWECYATCKLIDAPMWGGNHCASRTSPLSILRWTGYKGEVAEEWKVLSVSTKEDYEKSLAERS